MIKKAKNSEGEGGDPVAGVDLDFGELFRSLGDLVRLLGRLGEAGETHMERHGEFRIKGLGERAHGVYGFSIRSGIGDGRPRVEPFGNVHASEKGLVVEDVREPLVDVFDEGEETVITAELPGVLEREIAVRFAGDVVTIETFGERHYVKEVLLSAPVRATDFRHSYNNGVLEIRARKQDPDAGNST